MRSRFWRLTALAASVSVFAVSSAGTASAASTSTLKVDGFAKTFNLTSWNLAVDTPKPVKFGEVNFTKPMDADSATIMSDLVGGKFHSKAVLTSNPGNEKSSTPFVKYCFTDVVFTHYQARGMNTADFPEDSVSFSYGTMTAAISPLSPAGAIIGSVRVGWNALTRLSLASGTLNSC